MCSRVLVSGLMFKSLNPNVLMEMSSSKMAKTGCMISINIQVSVVRCQSISGLKGPY